MEKNHNFIKTIFNFSIASWVNIIVGLLYTILATRLLPPDTYGMISLFLSASNSLMYIICIGLDASFIRFFNERPNDEAKNLFSFKLIMVSSIVLLLCFFVSTFFFFDRFNQFVFGRLSWFLTIMLYTYVYTNLLLRYFNIIYRMSFNVKQYTLQNILVQSGVKILTVVAALVNPAYESVIAFQVIGISVFAIIYLYIQRNDIFPFDNEFKIINKKMYKGYKMVFKYALFSAPVYISINFNAFLTQQIILTTLGSIALGLYASVNIFSTLFGAVQNGFSTFWSAYVYKNYDNESTRIRLMSDYILLVAIFVISILVLFRRILYMFIGEQFQEGIFIFAIVLMVSVFNFLSQATVYGISIVKKNYITATTNVIYVIFNAIVVYIMSSYGGLLGAALALMIVRLLLMLVDTYISQKYYKSIQSKGRFLFGVIALIIIAVSPSLPIVEWGSYMLVIIILFVIFYVFHKQCVVLYNSTLSFFSRK